MQQQLQNTFIYPTKITIYATLKAELFFVLLLTQIVPILYWTSQRYINKVRPVKLCRNCAINNLWKLSCKFSDLSIECY